MSGKVLVIGGAGQLGHAASKAFLSAGWAVTSLARPSSSQFVAEGSALVEADGLNAEAVRDAAAGADVVLLAANPGYGKWPTEALPLVDNAIAASKAAGATLFFPGNLFNYGKRMPELIEEMTPMAPTSRKGLLRLEAERRIFAATEAEGLRAVILRAGDFFGGRPGSWFDLVITRDIDPLLNIVRYPGPLDKVHAWAYLPDFAQAIVRLAERRDQFEAFEPFGFPGHALTGRELLIAVQMDLGRRLKQKNFPWWLFHMLSPFGGNWRELSEVAYLWQMPHRISGARLEAVIGDIPQTPLAEAVRAALDGDNV